jgi:hypothetical protein
VPTTAHLFRTVVGPTVGLLLSACQSVPVESQMLKSWTGASQTELEKAWGPPMGKVFTKAGDQILLFEAPRVDASGDATPPGVARPRLNPTICRTLFTVSPVGTVTGAKSVGDGCADH